MGERRFVVELIKPSHYDDDGYVIQWVRSRGSRRTRSPASMRSRRTWRQRRALGPDVAIEINAYDECHTVIPVKRIIRRIKAADAGLVCLVGVQSNQFPRAVDLARAVPRRRRAGRDRRVSRLGLPGDAAGTAARHRGGARHRDQRCSPARPRDGSTRSSPTRSPGGCSRSTTTWTICPACRQQVTPFLPIEIVRRYSETLGRVRRRARLPVPVQLLHDHQRAGAQVALARRRRCRAAGARQPRAGRLPLLHHRRQFRAQPQLGGDLRPADRDAREGRARRCNSSSRSTRCATASRTLSRRRRAPAAAGSLSGWRTSTPTICWRPRKSRTGCTNTASCSSPGASTRSSPMPAISSASRATRRSGSRATSRPCSEELPVDLLEFFILTPLPGSADHQTAATRPGSGWTPT